jgi:hypothetical protein
MVTHNLLYTVYHIQLYIQYICTSVQVVQYPCIKVQITGPVFCICLLIYIFKKKKFVCRFFIIVLARSEVTYFVTKAIF